MAEIRTCPKCGARLPENAPSGICPKCLMQAGLESNADDVSASELNPMTRTLGFEPPEPEDLAQHFPHLEILELLGKGGMGAVYKARQPRLDRLVAVKILPPEIGADAAFAERFTREARALAKLSHQNIVSVFDFGQADGQFYFVMEFVDGTNLRQLIETGGLKPEEALAIVPQICEALQFAHNAGIVHRDIKPENILVDKQGRVKIADFGLAKLLGKARAEFSLTGAHQAMGTLHYMAPEQMRGAGSVDHRADIYSLGVVFYEMLTGQLPIGRFEPPSKKVHIDVRLDEIVLRSLENEPARRYQQVSEVKTAVEVVSGSSASLPAAVRVVTEAVLAQVERPGKWLFITSIVNWIGIPLLGGGIMLLISLYGSARMRAHLPDDIESALGIVILSLLPVNAFMMFAALKMRRLEGYWMAVVSAFAAMVVSPGNLMGLPVGIWALVVLSDRDVRAAFAQRRRARVAGSNRREGSDRGEPGPSAALLTPPPDVRSAIETEDEGITGWAVVRQSFLVLLSIVGTLTLFMPWTWLTFGQTFPDGGGSFVGLAVQGWYHWFPIVGSLLAAALLFVTLSTIGRSKRPLRAILAIATGLALTSLSLFTIVAKPLTVHPESYIDMVTTMEGHNARVGPLVLPGVQYTAYSVTDDGASALAELVRLSQTTDRWTPGKRHVTIHAEPFVGSWVALAAGLLLLLLGTWEFTSVVSASLQRMAVAPLQTASEAAQALRLTGMLGPLAFLIVLLMIWADLSINGAENPGQPWSLLRTLLIGAFAVHLFHACFITPWILFGANRLRTLSSPGAVRAASILAMLPLSFSAFVGIPSGLWSLFLLRGHARSSVDAELKNPVGEKKGTGEPGRVGQVFAAYHASESHGASPELQMQMRGPAVGLMLVAILAALFWLGNGYVQVNKWRYTGDALTGLDAREIVAILAIGVILVAACGCLILAAARMKTFRAYELCVASSILAMIPWSPAVLIGLPIGIWALRVLRRDDIMRAFQNCDCARQSSRVGREDLAHSTAGAVSWPALVFLLLIVNGAIFGVLLYFNHSGLEMNFAMSLYLALAETAFIGGGVSSTIVKRVWGIVSPPGEKSGTDPDSLSHSRATAPGSKRWLVPGIVLMGVVLAVVTGLIIAPRVFRVPSGAATIPTLPKTGEVWFGNKGAEHVMFWGPNSPTVSDRLARHLGLDPSQREAMDQAFQKYVREFRTLADQNTRRDTDENGHQITTIAAFPQQLPQLGERFWSELDSALDGRQLTLGRKMVHLTGGMFASAQFSYRIEIWRVGQINPWYHWKESYPDISTAPSADEPSSGPELPEKLRRFWKEPVTDAPQSPSTALPEPDRSE